MKSFWRILRYAAIVLILPATVFAQLSHIFTNTAHIDEGGFAIDVTLGADGTIFLANGDDGLRAYSYDGSSFTNTAHIHNGELIIGVALGADGTVFVAKSEDGLSAYSYDGSSFTNTANIDDGGFAEDVAVGADGTVFLANGDGGLLAYSYDGSSFTNTAFISNGTGFAEDVAVGADGTVFLANITEGLGAYSYDGSSFTNTAHIDNGGQAFGVAEGPDGTIFLANFDDGLRAYSYDGSSFTNTAHIDDGEFALGVTVGADGTIFLANNNGGLFAYSYDGSSFTNIAHINDGDGARSIALGADGTVFLANQPDGLRAYRFTELINTFIVTNTNDAGEGSLRQAILDANAHVNLDFDVPDSIKFEIDGAGPHTIQPNSALPAITDPVIIDGTTEPDANCDSWPATLAIELDGSNAGNLVTGLTLQSGSNGSTIRGLVINRFSSSGILISDSDSNKIECNIIGLDITGNISRGNGANGIRIINGAHSNLVGGIEFGAGNIISGNGSNGIFISGSGARNNRVQGNRIGTNAAGTADIQNNFGGISISFSNNNLIGGASSAARNLISGNMGNANTEGDEIGISFSDSNTVQGNYIGTNAAGTAAITNINDGISLYQSSKTNIIDNLISGNDQGIYSTYSDSSVVQGNFIGTDASGTVAIPNEDGLFLLRKTRDFLIGGSAPGQGNLISGNLGSGIVISSGVRGNIVQGNRIGTDITGSLALGNDGNGVFLGSLLGPRPSEGAANVVGGLSSGAGNIIAFNGGSGIVITNYGNIISGNAIFNNGQLGIDLDRNGVTANDEGDDDLGGNDLQNYPLLTSAETDGGEITITGTFNSTPNTNDFVLEFFANTVCNGDQNGNPQSDDYGEGEIFLGYTTVSTDANGDASFSVNLTADVAAGAFITATATSPDSNTSEFSQCIVAADGSLHSFLLLSAMDIEISGLQLSAGDMHANDDITFNKGFPGTHTGNLSAVDNIDISSKNTIDGDVNAGGDLDNDGTINGAANGSASVEPVDLPILTPFTAGTEDVTIPGGYDVTLLPGMNKDVVVERDGTLRLTAGEYFLDELEFGTDTRLIVDVSSGDVVVNIVSDLEFGQRMITSVEGGSTSRFTINSIQTKNIDFGREATVIATIIAPDAKVRAGSYVRFSGSMCAKDIAFSSGPVIVGHNASLPKVVVNDEADVAALLQVFALEQNYPNPFNPTTNIGFQISNFEFVQLKIYDISGRLVKTLVNERRAAGNYTVSWDATNDFGTRVASGVYLYKLQAADFVQVKKMVLLK